MLLLFFMASSEGLFSADFSKADMRVVDALYVLAVEQSPEVLRLERTLDEESFKRSGWGRFLYASSVSTGLTLGDSLDGRDESDFESVSGPVPSYRVGVSVDLLKLFERDRLEETEADKRREEGFLRAVLARTYSELRAAEMRRAAALERVRALDLSILAEEARLEKGEVTEVAVLELKDKRREAETQAFLESAERAVKAERLKAFCGVSGEKLESVLATDDYRLTRIDSKF